MTNAHCLKAVISIYKHLMTWIVLWLCAFKETCHLPHCSQMSPFFFAPKISLILYRQLAVFYRTYRTVEIRLLLTLRLAFKSCPLKIATSLLLLVEESSLEDEITLY